MGVGVAKGWWFVHMQILSAPHVQSPLASSLVILTTPKKIKYSKSLKSVSAKQRHSLNSLFVFRKFMSIANHSVDY